jgi:hypothetical protein
MDLERLRQLAGITNQAKISTTGKSKKLNESAPPGMENLVMKLKIRLLI